MARKSSGKPHSFPPDKYDQMGFIRCKYTLITAPTAAEYRRENYLFVQPLDNSFCRSSLNIPVMPKCSLAGRINLDLATEAGE